MKCNYCTNDSEDVTGWLFNDGEKEKEQEFVCNDCINKMRRKCNEDKIEISKHELRMMIEEFWANNNEECEKMTIIFLEKHGFNDVDICNILNVTILLRINKEDKTRYDSYLES